MAAPCYGMWDVVVTVSTYKGFQSESSIKEKFRIGVLEDYFSKKRAVEKVLFREPLGSASRLPRAVFWTSLYHVSLPQSTDR